MHHYWAYGLAVLLIILLVIAAVYVAREENQEDKRARRVRLARPRKTPVVQLPLDFGAL